jgi:hypothetical protein
MRFPESSAASLKAPPGHAPAVTQSLAGDPPLPGAEQHGWSGLDQAPQAGAADAGAVGDPHAQHRGHHAH